MPRLNVELLVDDKGSVVVRKFGDTAGRAMQQASGAADTLYRSFTSLNGVLASLGAGYGVAQIVKTADEYKNLNNRLKLVTDSSKELADVREKLFAISRESRQADESTIDLYSRIARSTKDLNIQDAERLRVTETINKSLVISGAASESAKAAIIQLGQGFASGTLRGEELNSVLEQAPRLAEAIASGMGVSVGKLRQLGQEGELTAEKVIRALLSQSAAIDTEFSKMEATVGQSFTVLNNSLGRLIGDSDQASSATSQLAGGIIGVADSIDEWRRNNAELLGQDLPGYVDAVKGGISGLIDVWQAVPAELQAGAGIGIVGAMLFGGQAGLLIGSVVTLNEALAAYEMNFGSLLDKWREYDQAVGRMREKATGGRSLTDLLGGHFDFKTLSWQTPGGVDISEAEDMRMLRLASQASMAQNAMVNARSATAADVDKLRLKLHSEAAEKLTEATNQAREAAAKLEKKWAEVSAELAADTAQAGLSGIELELARIAERADKLRKTFGDREEITIWEQTAAAAAKAAAIDRLRLQLHEEAAKRARELAEANAKLKDSWDEITLEALPEHEREIERINRQYQEWRDKLPELYEYLVRVVGLTEDAAWDKVAAIDEGLAQQNAKALKELEDKHRQTADATARIWDHTFERLEDITADWLKQGKVDLDSLKDFFKGVVAQMVASWLWGQGQMKMASGAAGSGGTLAGGFGLQSSGSFAGTLFGSPGVMMGLDQLFNMGGMMTMASMGSAFFQGGTAGLAEWGASAGSFMSLAYDIPAALMELSPALEGIATWISDLGSALDMIPGGLAGVLNFASGVYNLTQGNTVSGIADLATAAAWAINPVAGMIATGLNFIGKITGILGSKEYTPTPYVQLLDRNGINSEVQFWAHGDPYPTGNTMPLAGDLFDHPNAAIQPFADAARSIGDNWAKAIDQMAGAFGDLGEQWRKDTFGVTINDPNRPGYDPTLPTGTGIKKFQPIDLTLYTGVSGDAVNIALKMINQKISDAMAPAFTDLLGRVWSEIRDKAPAWDMLTAERQQKTEAAVGQLPKPVAGMNPEDFSKSVQDYATGIQLIQSGLAAIEQITDGITETIRQNSVNQYAIQLEDINTKFDQYSATLEKMGVDMVRYTALEDARQMVIADFLEGVRKPVVDILDAHRNSEFARALRDLSVWQDEQLAGADAVKEAMTSADYLQWVEDINAAAAYQAQDLIDRYITPVTTAWQDWLTGMDTSSLAPVQSVEAMTARYQGLLGEAATGGLDAIAALERFVTGDYLPFMQAFSGDYKSVWDQLFGQSGDLRTLSIDLGPALAGLTPAALSDAMANALGEALVPLLLDSSQKNVTLTVDNRSLGSVVIGLLKSNSDVRDTVLQLVNGG